MLTTGAGILLYRFWPDRNVDLILLLTHEPSGV
jgi:hypothetical protein